MPLRENSVIVFNIFLHGLPASGKKTFLHWLVENGNILDANFLKSIENEQKLLKDKITTYMKNINELPFILKENLNQLIQDKKFEEAKTFFEVASSRIQQLCRSFDGEINHYTKKAISHLQKVKLKVDTEQSEYFSCIEIAGSTPNMIYRIHYIKKTPYDLLQFNELLSSIDGIIFIWDARWELIEENSHLLENFLNNLPPNNQYPFVIALNKIDLPNTIHSEDVKRLLTQFQFEEKLQTSLFTDTIYSGLTIFETTGISGINIRNVLINCIRMITNKSKAQIQELQKGIFQEARVRI